jgi:YcxB-like protein
MAFSYELSPGLGRLAFRRYTQRHVGIPISFVAVVAIACSVALFVGYRQWYFIVGLVIGCMFVLARVNNYISSGAAFKSIPDPTVTVRIADDSIEFETTEYTSIRKWGSIKQVWRFPDVWLFFADSVGSYTPIPAEVLSDERKAIIEKMVLEHGGKVT